MNSLQEINALADSLDAQCIQSIEATPNLNENECTIIARILSPKPLNMNAFKAMTINAWNPSQKPDTNLLENNTMVFIFHNKTDMEKVLNNSWTFRDYQIIITKWPAEKSLHEIDLTKITFWIQASGIPVAYINSSTAKIIGDAVGIFVKTDLNSPNQKWRKSIRIQIEMDIMKPLISHITIPCKGRSPILVEIRYERLTDCCFKCGFLGHKIPDCNSEEADQSSFIGPWMKSENKHLKNPIFHAPISPLSHQPKNHVESPQNSSQAQSSHTPFHSDDPPKSSVNTHLTNLRKKLFLDTPDMTAPSLTSPPPSDGMVLETHTQSHISQTSGQKPPFKPISKCLGPTLLAILPAQHETTTKLGQSHKRKLGLETIPIPSPPTQLNNIDAETLNPHTIIVPPPQNQRKKPKIDQTFGNSKPLDHQSWEIEDSELEKIAAQYDSPPIPNDRRIPYQISRSESAL
ncbi:hypothetical protein CASFOL_000140 [Castilleja foliolosa]|uniref:CCHC-type domain-containing protein n=1 Tax=Castilleja foliolosa TaxID=1961234 RepID=A0ABD3ERQ8_9LAMI